MAQIRRIGLTYYVRYTVPKDRWQDAGRREVIRTLQTRDLKEARKRLGPALETIRRDLDEVLAGKGLPSVSSGWTPSWGSLTQIVDAALIARTEIEQASSEPIYVGDNYEGTGQDLARDHVLEVAAGIAEQQGDEAFRTFHDIAMGVRTPITAPTRMKRSSGSSAPTPTRAGSGPTGPLYGTWCAWRS